jgi:hypothetical protein
MVLLAKGAQFSLLLSLASPLSLLLLVSLLPLPLASSLWEVTGQVEPGQAGWKADLWGGTSHPWSGLLPCSLVSLLLLGMGEDGVGEGVGGREDMQLTAGASSSIIVSVLIYILCTCLVPYDWYCAVSLLILADWCLVFTVELTDSEFCLPLVQVWLLWFLSLCSCWVPFAVGLVCFWLFWIAEWAAKWASFVR